jgi:hypothetical protein
MCVCVREELEMLQNKVTVLTRYIYIYIYICMCVCIAAAQQESLSGGRHCLRAAPSGDRKHEVNAPLPQS